jgi:hypothetical protein
VLADASLQDLVGKNLTYISQLDGLTFDLYSQSVLPRLLEQVSHPAKYCGGCRDAAKPAMRHML